VIIAYLQVMDRPSCGLKAVAMALVL